MSREAAGSAETRVLRILYLSIGIGGLVYLGVGFSKASSQLEVQEPVWAAAAYGVSILGPVTLLALAPWARLRTLGAVAMVYAIAFWAVMVTLPAATPHQPLPESGSPWTNDLMAVPAIALAAAARHRPLAVYVIGTSVTSGIIRYATSPGVGAPTAILDLAYNLLFDCVFVAITLVTRSSAARLDEAADAARLKTAAEAEASARVQQRIRIDALVHDHVLSALLIASRADDVPTPALRELAATTLRTLREDALPPHELLTGDDFAGRLRSSVTTQSSGIEFDVAIAPTTRIPADIAQALVEATSEAVRNSLRHAGAALERPVALAVTVTTADGAVEVVVADDGRGFNSRRIPPERLGVRVSILNRMATLPGGRADIESSRGRGTRVTLGWSAAEAS